MVKFPNCKINIGLEIKGKRADGFHELETVFYPLAIHEVLEIIPSGVDDAGVRYSGSGIHVEGPEEQNLCVKAYRLLKEDFPRIPSIQMHLHKTIPTGAGLGGGSADAAVALQLLNEKFGLQLTAQQFAGYALQLGSDCPFFLYNKPALATGRGEKLEQVSVDLSSYKLMLVHPGIHINTGWAFSQLALNDNPASPLRERISQPVSTWRDCITNDFEIPVFKTHPEIKKIKEALYSSGAIYASMSGSGSSVYGIFGPDAVPPIIFPSHYFCKVV